MDAFVQGDARQGRIKSIAKLLSLLCNRITVNCKRLANMTDKEIYYTKLYQKYGEAMTAKEVMRELGFGNTRRLNAISVELLPKAGGGRRGVRVSYRTEDVANYMLLSPPRNVRGSRVEFNVREFRRFSARYGLTPKEKGELFDAWTVSLMYGDESASLDVKEITALGGGNPRALNLLAARGIPLNPLQSGVFGVAA